MNNLFFWKKVFALMLLFFLFISVKIVAQNKTHKVNSFDQIIVSPHIRVILKEGENESVYIENEGVEDDKINVEVAGKILRIYLDQARIYTKHYKTYVGGQKIKNPVYRGTLVTAHITYKNLKNLTVRGEETVTCESANKYK
jgi:hypothetical protein